VLYGLGAVAFGVKDNGFQFFLLLYYNQVLGLPESWVGLGIMVALVADALLQGTWRRETVLDARREGMGDPATYLRRGRWLAPVLRAAARTHP